MFLSPLFLWGLAALGVPVAIHLMHSTKAEVIRFSTIRFLKNCQRRAARRTRLKQIILMALRMLLLALIVLGLSKPVVQSDKSSAASGKLATSMILIIDNSYSMGFREQGVSRFERAKKVAFDLIDSLDVNRHDELAVIVMNRKSEPFIKDFTPDLGAAKSQVAKIKLSSHGTDVAGALSQAYTMMGAAKNARREIHLLTDLQAYSWSKLLEDNFIKSERPPRPKLFVSSFGKPNSQNTWIRGITIAGASSSGIGSKLVAEIETVGAGSLENVVTLSVDKEKKDQALVRVRPGEPAQVPLEVDFDQPGNYRCTLSLNEDSLRVDDTYEFNLSVDDRVTVLVVDGDYSSAARSLSESFYLNLALNPSSVTGVRAGSEIEPRVVPLAEFSRTKFDTYKCVILCNVEKLDGSDLVRLESFLNTGGSVMIFLGSKVNLGEYNKWSFLPARLRGIEGSADRRDTFSFGRLAARHPIFQDMEDLRTTRIFRYFNSDGTRLFDGAEVLAWVLQKNAPLIVERTYGPGRVMMITTTADRDWTNLPLRRTFVPLVHKMVKYMCGRQAASQAYKVGDEVKFVGLRKYQGDEVKVTTPNGITSTVRLEAADSYAIGTFSDTLEPGLYKVASKHKDFTNSSGFSVNPDVRESDMTMIAVEKLEAEFKGLDVVVLASPGQTVTTVTESREGWKLWPLLFKLGLLFFCLEILVANLFSRTVEHEGVQMPLFEYLKLRRGGGLAE